MALITVIVPVYQVEPYLRRCVDSILYQSFDDYDVILIDDGSRDGSSEICDQYADNYEKVNVIHQVNAGLSSARNAGIEWAINHSDSQYITFVDSDDWIHPQYLDLLHSAMIKTGCKISLCHFCKADDHTCLVENNRISYAMEKTADLFCKEYGNFVVAWGKLYQKTDFTNLRYPVGKIYEDEFTTWKVLFRYKDIAVVNYELYAYYQRSDSIMGRGWVPEKIDVLDAMEEVRDWFVLQDNNLLLKTVQRRLVGFCTNQIQNMKEYGCSKKQIRQLRIRLRKYIFDAKDVVSFRSHYQSYAEAWPILYSFVWPMRFLVHVVRNACRGSIRGRIQYLNDYFELWLKYLIYKNDTTGLSKESYWVEFKKYKDCLLNRSERITLKTQIDEFFTRKMEILSNVQPFTLDNSSPTVICVVKNEKSRMSLFYDYYRKLGVKQFAILDNGSTDGTCEFLLSQPDTHVYSVRENFQTQKKEAWIEKILAMEGYNKWYLVVDSDELFDYPGREEYTIDQFIKVLEKRKVQRAWGMMLDMYSKQDLFSVECDPLSIPEIFSFFDSDSYTRYRKSVDRKKPNVNAIVGGPRYRLFGGEMWQSKQSVFFFSKNILYRNCHYLYPEIGWEDAPFCFVLKHYKFLKMDETIYRQRIKEKCFYNNSAEYSQQMEAIRNGINSMYYEKSVHYENSYSLLKLPYLINIFEDSYSD